MMPDRIRVETTTTTTATVTLWAGEPGRAPGGGRDTAHHAAVVYLATKLRAWSKAGLLAELDRATDQWRAARDPACPGCQDLPYGPCEACNPHKPQSRFRAAYREAATALTDYAAAPQLATAVALPTPEPVAVAESRRRLARWTRRGYTG